MSFQTPVWATQFTTYYTTGHNCCDGVWPIFYNRSALCRDMVMVVGCKLVRLPSTWVQCLGQCRIPITLVSTPITNSYHITIYLFWLIFDIQVTNWSLQYWITIYARTLSHMNPPKTKAQNPKPHLKLRRIYEFLILTENKTTMPRNCTNLVVALVPYKAF